MFGMFYAGAFLGMLLGLLIAALDRWLFAPITDRTVERAKKEAYFKRAARKAALEQDEDDRL